jgi:hypothetical protein
VRRVAALVGFVLALSSCGDSPERGVETGGSPQPPVAEGCPERYAAAGDEPWVPAPPTTETPDRLVPDADPVEALVCRYGDVSGAGGAPLDGEVRLEAGLDRIRTDLLLPARVEGAQPACAEVGGAVVPHLVRLRYADGELWLSARQEPNGCTASGNGRFVTSAYLGDRLAQAYDARAWPVRDPDPCAEGGSGRAGQEQALVPPGWASLVACAEDGGRREVDPDRAAQVASLLGQLGTQPGTNACEGAPATVTRLVFTHAEGPPVVVVWTPGCEPSLSNGSLSAVPTPAQTELLGVLLG